jgi:hypothetical protein
MSRNKLYVLLSTACAAGYIWLAVIYHQRITNSIEPGVCLFKRLTNIPCPSCGSTRSVLSLMKGDFQGALFWNPFGIILMIILISSPFWIFYDVVSRKKTLLNAYIKTELILKRKWIALPAILLVMLNWIWNISKGL